MLRAACIPEAHFRRHAPAAIAVCFKHPACLQLTSSWLTRGHMALLQCHKQQGCHAANSSRCCKSGMGTSRKGRRYTLPQWAGLPWQRLLWLTQSTTTELGSSCFDRGHCTGLGYKQPACLQVASSWRSRGHSSTSRTSFNASSGRPELLWPAPSQTSSSPAADPAGATTAQEGRPPVPRAAGLPQQQWR